MELTFSRDSPFYANKKLRELGAAASQFVFTNVHDSESLCTAGATPKEIATNDYGLVPLVCLDDDSCTAMDRASEIAQRDVIIPLRKYECSR